MECRDKVDTSIAARRPLPLDGR